MPGVKVLIKGLNKVIEFPPDVPMQEIEKAIKGNWDSVAEIKGLPIDKKSRMERAKYLGFDESNTVFHGTRQTFDSFKSDKPTYFAPDPGLSNTFARMGGDEGGTVIPAHIKAKNTFDYTNDDHLNALESSLESTGDLYQSDIYGNSVNVLDGVRAGQYKMIEDERTLNGIKRAGYDSFFIREQPERQAFLHSDKIKSGYFANTQEGKKEGLEFYKKQLDRWRKYGDERPDLKPVVKNDAGGLFVEYKGDTFNKSGLTEDSKNELKRNIAIFDPKNIRSTNATFDPSKKDSANLLAGIGAAGVGISALAPQDASAQGQPTNSLAPNITNPLLSMEQLAKLPGHLRPDVGSIRGPIKGDSDVVAAIQDLGGLLSKFEVPVLGNPAQGLADYMQNFGYNDSQKERLKRAAMAVLDFL